MNLAIVALHRALDKFETACVKNGLQMHKVVCKADPKNEYPSVTILLREL